MNKRERQEMSLIDGILGLFLINAIICDPKARAAIDGVTKRVNDFIRSVNEENAGKSDPPVSE